MKKFSSYLMIVFIFTLIWIILNEKLNLFTVLTGAGISVIAVFFTSCYLLLEDYKVAFSFSALSIIRYIIYLLIQIYKSGIASIRIILKGDTNAVITEYKTSLTDDLSICLLATAITLTPGTVTVDKVDHTLKILHFDLPEDAPGASIKSGLTELEDILKRRKT